MKKRPDNASVFSERVASLIRHSENRPWLSDAQSAARDALVRHGLPHSKDEAWRFTPLQATYAIDFSLPSAEPDWEALQAQAERVLGEVRGVRVFILGTHIRCLSGEGSRGIEVARVSSMSPEASSALATGDSRVAGRDGFAWLNDALATDGVAIRVSKCSGEVPSVDLVVGEAETGEVMMTLPRFWLQLSEEAQLQFTELHLPCAGAKPSLRVGLGEIRVGKGAILQHLRVANGSSSTHSIASIEVQQSQDSRYFSRAITLGGSLSRLTLRVQLNEPGAECDLSGLYLAEGQETVDHHTLIDHVEGDCSSRQLFKGIVNGAARAIFDGTVVVRRDAQRTSARQENRNLVLSDDAVVHTKPHLEIDADDVVCSHGATVGQLRDDEVFYLRARGIDEATARAMLTYAFAREMLDAIPDPFLKERLIEAVLRRLPEAERLEGSS